MVFNRLCVQKKYLGALEAYFLLNAIILSIVVLFLDLLKLDYQLATIVSISLSLVVCLVTMAMYIQRDFDLKRMKRRLGLRDRPDEYRPTIQVETDRSPPGSPPSIVYMAHVEESISLYWSFPILMKRMSLPLQCC